jgi:hypothetical protein
MIRVVVYGPAKTGFFPYRIDGHWGPEGAPLLGIAEDPLAEACRVLAALNVPPGTWVKLVPYRGNPITTMVGHLGQKALPRPLLPVGMVPLADPPKAPPRPRRARRRVSAIPTGSGIPGDF